MAPVTMTTTMTLEQLKASIPPPAKVLTDAEIEAAIAQHAANRSRGCDTTATVDRRAASVPGFTAIGGR